MHLITQLFFIFLHKPQLIKQHKSQASMNVITPTNLASHFHLITLSNNLSQQTDSNPFSDTAPPNIIQPPTTTTKKVFLHTKLYAYFAPPALATKTHNYNNAKGFIAQPCQLRPKSTTRQCLLSYSKQTPTHPPMTHYLANPSIHADTWGHSLISIDTSKVFWILLQNPNCLKLTTKNSTQQDFQTCKKYGTAAIMLPETNTNWSRQYQRETLRTILHNTWETSSHQTSHLQEPFLSSY